MLVLVLILVVVLLCGFVSVVSVFACVWFSGFCGVVRLGSGWGLGVCAVGFALLDLAFGTLWVWVFDGFCLRGVIWICRLFRSGLFWCCGVWLWLGLVSGLGVWFGGAGRDFSVLVVTHCGLFVLCDLLSCFAGFWVVVFTATFLGFWRFKPYAAFGFVAFAIDAVWCECGFRGCLGFGLFCGRFRVLWVYSVCVSSFCIVVVVCGGRFGCFRFWYCFDLPVDLGLLGM